MCTCTEIPKGKVWKNIYQDVNNGSLGGRIRSDFLFSYLYSSALCFFKKKTMNLY